MVERYPHVAYQDSSQHKTLGSGKYLQDKVKVGLLHRVQQPGLYWHRSPVFPLVTGSQTHTKVTACYFMPKLLTTRPLRAPCLQETLYIIQTFVSHHRRFIVLSTDFSLKRRAMGNTCFGEW